MILLLDKAPNTCIVYTIISIEKMGGGARVEDSIDSSLTISQKARVDSNYY